MLRQSVRGTYLIGNGLSRPADRSAGAAASASDDSVYVYYFFFLHFHSNRCKKFNTLNVSASEVAENVQFLCLFISINENRSEQNIKIRKELQEKKRRNDEII